jgi:SAM-dependent methyltransferase
MSTTAEELRERVRERYAQAARAAETGLRLRRRRLLRRRRGRRERGFGEALYTDEQRGELPDAAALASLGCGNPIAVAELREGETVLDLGSGGGIDVILSAGASADRLALRPRHDGRDARARAPQRARTRRPQRRSSCKGVIEDVRCRRLGRRRDLELRHQPLDRQGRGAREIARVLKPGGRVGSQRRRRRGRLSPRSARERGASSAASPARSRSREYARASRRRASRT